MKAPREVWVELNHKGGIIGCETASVGYGDIRYLRTDLSCQDCREFLSMQKDLPCWCPMGLPPFSVACMSFKYGRKP